MLNAMREGAKSGFIKIILMGLMCLAVGGLVLMDVGGFFRGGIRSTSIAKIDGQDMPIQVFDNTLRRTLANQNLDVATAYRLGLINQVLKNEISGNLMERATHDMGLQVSDDAVVAQINKLIAPLVTDKMDKKTALQAVLRNQGLSEQGLMQMVRSEMSNNLLRNAIQLGTQAPATQLAKNMYLFNNEQRTVRYIHLPHSSVKTVKEPNDEILKAFYEAGKHRYAIPETRSFSVALLSQDKLEKTIDVSDDELHSIYERDKDSYTVAEQRKIQQAVLETEAEALEIAAAAKEGKSVKQAVTDKTGKEDAYIGEQEFEKSGLPEDLGNAAFDAKSGDVVGPVQSALGWHVMKVTGIIAPKTKSYDEVKEDLKKEIVQMRLADQMYQAGNELDDLLAGGMSLDDAAKEMDLEIRTFGPLKQDGSTTDSKDGLKEFGPDWGAIIETAFGLQEGETAPVMELADGRYGAVRVDNISAETYKPFEDVKAELSKTWIQDQREVENKLRAEEALRQIENGEKTLADVATSLNAQVATAKLVRDKEAEAPLSNGAKAAFFGLAPNMPGFAPVDDGFVIGEVTAKTLPDSAKIPEEDMKKYAELAQRSEQGEFIQVYLNHLQSGYDVKINQRLIDATYGPGSEQY